MPEWELHPHQNFPQTPELYLDQLEQELVSIERKKEYVLSEKERVSNDLGIYTVSTWVEKAREEGHCCVFNCTDDGFPYCGGHDAP